MRFIICLVVVVVVVTCAQARSSNRAKRNAEDDQKLHDLKVREQQRRLDEREHERKLRRLEKLETPHSRRKRQAVDDPCANMTCPTGFSCNYINITGQAFCLPVDLCSYWTCNNGGTCYINNNGLPACSCVPGRTGIRCEHTEGNPCANVTCPNGGSCFQNYTTGQAECSPNPYNTSTTTMVTPSDIPPAAAGSCRGQPSRMRLGSSMIVFSNRPNGGNYPNNYCKQWNVYPRDNKCVVVKVAEEGFNTEAGYDFVTFKENNASNETQTRRSGNYSVGDVLFNSGPNNVTVRFTTDGSVTASGFGLNISAIPCSDRHMYPEVSSSNNQTTSPIPMSTTTEQTTMMTPPDCPPEPARSCGQPAVVVPVRNSRVIRSYRYCNSSYLNNWCEKWNITTFNSSKCVVIKVGAGGFSTEAGYDFVTFRDPNASSWTRTRIAGWRSEGETLFTSRTSNVTVSFSTDYSVTQRGFVLNVTAVPCSNTTNYPNVTGNNQTTISTMPTTTFSTMTTVTPPPSNCSLPARSCDPQAVTLQSGDPVGISSSSCNGQYPDNWCQVWNVTAGAGECIVVNVTDGFNTEQGYDFVEFWDTNENAARTHREGYHAMADILFTSQTNEITVNFRTDGSVRRPGFNLTLTAIDCSDRSNYTELTSSSGGHQPSTTTTPPSVENPTIFLDDYPAGYEIRVPDDDNATTYSNNMRVVWTFAVRTADLTNKTIKFQVMTNFTTEPGYDFLSILNRHGQPIARLDGQYPENFPMAAVPCGTTPGVKAVVNFTSDGSVTAQGFSVAVKLVDGDIDLCEPNPCQNNKECRMREGVLDLGRRHPPSFPSGTFEDEGTGLFQCGTYSGAQVCCSCGNATNPIYYGFRWDRACANYTEQATNSGGHQPSTTTTPPPVENPTIFLDDYPAGYEIRVPDDDNATTYSNNMRVVWTFAVRTADLTNKTIKFQVITNFTTEQGFDFLSILNRHGQPIARLDGQYPENFPLAAVPCGTTQGVKAVVNFTSDGSVTAQGFSVAVKLVDGDIDLCEPNPCQNNKECRKREGLLDLGRQHPPSFPSGTLEDEGMGLFQCGAYSGAQVCCSCGNATNPDYYGFPWDRACADITSLMPTSPMPPEY